LCTRALHTYLHFCPAVWALRYARQARQQLRDADHHSPKPETSNVKRVTQPTQDMPGTLSTE